MKKPVAALSVLALSVTLAGVAKAESYMLVTSCRAELSVISPDPNVPNIIVEGASQPYAGGDGVLAYAHSHVLLSLGTHTLSAGLDMGSISGSSTMQPLLRVELYKGNPVQGQVNYGAVAGLDLDQRPSDLPLTFTSMNFANMQVNGQNVSRIDYTCAVTKQ